ncbi:MAG: hypothetical protein C5B44_02300 [Acidobacteria bacterium]|nr:MAG: hypothetical protein C5B44_02300 [Acidobacteriota bacterium]
MKLNSHYLKEDSVSHDPKTASLIGADKCRICGNARGNKFHKVREMFFGKRDIFTYVECATCQTVQIQSVPDLTKYYPRDYYSFEQPDKDKTQRSGFAKTVSRSVGLLARQLAARAFCTNSRFLDVLLKPFSRATHGFPAYLKNSQIALGISPNSKILDFGSGAGQTMKVLRHFGFNNLTGVDPYIEHDIDLGKGAWILRTNLEHVNGPFDLILANHSLEHVPDPRRTLQELLRLLTPGHHAIIRMPVLSYAWRHYGANWVQLDAPRHLFLFATDSFKALAEKIGFTVKRIDYDSSAFQFWGSEQYAQDIPLLDPQSYFVDADKSIFSAPEIANFELRAQELNTKGDGDQAVFYLQKPDIEQGSKLSSL